MLRRLVVIGLAAVLTSPLLAASAATTTGIGSFTPLTGSSTAFRSTMQLPATGFPEATVTSTSRSGQVGVQSGASTWFGENSPVGAVYGSSRDEPYLNLRPRADNASAPSVTTYTFERATPQGWAFVLGDIDADQVEISGTTADGAAVTAADLGFQSTFNLCGTSPRPSGCSTTQTKDEPSWTAGNRTLVGNTGAEDTYGAAAWFQPTTSLRTLTFTFTRRAGLPVFQTWFAVTKQDVTGTIAGPDGTCDGSGTTVNLLDTDGTVLDTTEAGDDGTYAFTGVAASAGYRVEISDVAAGCIADGATRAAVDLSDGDDTADFAIREIVPAPISGFVRDDDGTPVPGVTVTISGVGAPRTATTDSNGFYLFDTNDEGTYSLTVAPPAGYDVDSSPADVTVEADDVDPVTDRNFVLDARPTLSGTVSDATGGVGGVTVVLNGPGGAEIDRTVSAADGTYSFPRLPAGDYTVTVPDPPGDYRVPEARDATIDDADETADFALAQPGSISGSVTDDATGDPVPGTRVTIDGPDGTVSTTTDAGGSYLFGDLDPGTYTVTVGDDVESVTIPPLGGSIGGVDFVVAADDTGATPTPTPTPTPTATTGTGTSAGSTGTTLPDTGAPSPVPAVIAVLLLLGGGVCVWRGRAALPL